MRNLILFLSLLCTLMLRAQPVQIVIGSGTSFNSNTGYPAPYGTYYWGARHQFLIKATEIQAAGINGSRIISELGFNVKTPIAGGMLGFTISLKNTATTAFPTTGYAFEAGTTPVFGPQNIAVAADWNMHQFHTPFLWDGTSNILVEVCFNNTSYSTNSSTYYSASGFGSSIYIRDDASGVCGMAANTRSTNRPNMKLGMSLPLPPVASFTAPDTAYLNIPVSFKNASSHTLRSYWRIDTTVENSLCNTIGCFADTTSLNFNYTFTTQGLYKITLYTKGYTGQTDSFTRFVYADTTSRKPKANFYASTQHIGIFDIVNFYDSSLYGATAWEWSINPPCVTCGQFANVFTPSVYAKNVALNTFDPGVYDVCLKVWNDKGFDTICKEKYLNILPSYFMCNGADSLSRGSYGMVTDLGGTTNNYTIGLVGQCASGFVINPSQCADTVFLFIDQFKLRSNDTLEFRNGTTLSAPLIAKYGGGNLTQAQRIVKASSGTVFMRFRVGTGVTSAGDSGFVIRWETSPSANIIKNNNTFCDADSLLLRSSKRANRQYEWMYAGSTLSTDSFVYARAEGDYQLTVTGTGCADVSEVFVSKNVRPDAGHNLLTPALQCLPHHVFRFTDQSTLNKGTYSNVWAFSDGTLLTADTAVKSFTSPGVYTLAHIAVSDSGCTDTAYSYIRVLGAPDISVLTSGQTEICAYDSLLLTANSTLSGSFLWFQNDTLLTTGNSIYGKANKAYSVKFTDQYGCDSLTAPYLVKARPMAVKPQITRNGIRIETSSAAPALLWYINNTPQTVLTTPTIVPAQNGVYMVRADSNGCSVFSDPFMVVFTTVETALINKDVRVYPNPLWDKLTIETLGAFTWTIADMSGKRLLNGCGKQQQEVLDISSLSSGVYILHVNDEKSHAVIRILKR